MRASDLFDDYIDGRMNAADRSRFESQVAQDEVLAAALDEHLQLLSALGKHSKRTDLKKQLLNIHEKEFGVNNRVIAMQREENFASRHGKTIAVAASTALIAVLSTVAILSTGGYLLKQQSNQITDLNRVVRELKASSDAIVEGITRGNQKKVVYAPANLEGSAFALNNQGYVLTSFHMVNGADSIFIQNSQTSRALATLFFSDPSLDLAVLKIQDDSISKGWDVPFTLKARSADLGDKVFTLGYPRRDVVYGEGALSSLSGYSNDTSMYQISIPVNPGNSGGPLLDEQGNVIGVIRGKISGAEATGFAIKANLITSAIRSSADSSSASILGQNPKKNSLKLLKRSEQIKRINPYVFNVLVYKEER
jgi:serine protease Do